MIKYSWLLLVCSPFLFSCAQRKDEMPPSAKTFVHQLGETRIQVSETVYRTVYNEVFIQLHHNERTALRAAREIIKSRGGRMLALENAGDHIVDFSTGNQVHRFDPNRVFTRTGRDQTLKVFKTFSPLAAEELQAFSSFILSLFPARSYVISLHNNTNGEYDVKDYRSALSGDARDVYIHPGMDADDFVFTTDKKLFQYLREKQVSVVLQDNNSVNDDGSLSVWLGGQGRPYANIEAEEGHFDEQLRMAGMVLDFVRKR